MRQRQPSQGRQSAQSSVLLLAINVVPAQRLDVLSIKTLKAAKNDLREFFITILLKMVVFPRILPPIG